MKKNILCEFFCKCQPAVLVQLVEGKYTASTATGVTKTNFKVNQSQSRTETIDSNIFSANENVANRTMRTD